MMLNQSRPLRFPQGKKHPLQKLSNENLYISNETNDIQVPIHSRSPVTLEIEIKKASGRPPEAFHLNRKNKLFILNTLQGYPAKTKTFQTQFARSSDLSPIFLGLCGKTEGGGTSLLWR